MGKKEIIAPLAVARPRRGLLCARHSGAVGRS
jgi:hypothetical protein